MKLQPKRQIAVGLLSPQLPHPQPRIQERAAEIPWPRRWAVVHRVAVPRAVVPRAVRVVKPVVADPFNYRAIPLLQPWATVVRKVVAAMTPTTPWGRATIRRTLWAVVTPDRILTAVVALAVKTPTPKVATPKIRWVRALIRRTPWAVVTPDRILMAVAAPVAKILTPKAVTLRIRWVAAILAKTPTAQVDLHLPEMVEVEPAKALWTSRFPAVRLVEVDRQARRRDLQHRQANRGMGTRVARGNPLHRKH